MELKIDSLALLRPFSQLNRCSYLHFFYLLGKHNYAKGASRGRCQKKTGWLFRDTFWQPKKNRIIAANERWEFLMSMMNLTKLSVQQSKPVIVPSSHPVTMYKLVIMCQQLQHITCNGRGRQCQTVSTGPTLDSLVKRHNHMITTGTRYNAYSQCIAHRKRGRMKMPRKRCSTITVGFAKRTTVFYKCMK